MTDRLRYPPRPRAMLERRIRHQFGVPDSLARVIAEQWATRGRE